LFQKTKRELKKMNKSLIDFLNVLLRATEENIKFLCGTETFEIFEIEKYKEEICKIQDLINSFKFDENKKLVSLKWVDPSIGVICVH
jgi:hypothetical protein